MPALKGRHGLVPVMQSVKHALVAVATDGSTLSTDGTDEVAIFRERSTFGQKVLCIHRNPPIIQCTPHQESSHTLIVMDGGRNLVTSGSNYYGQVTVELNRVHAGL